MYLLLKRGIDVVASAAILVAAAPLLAIVALAIKLQSAGPVLYRAPRVGRGGRSFFMYKFRTMVVDADRIGGPSTADGDPRVTPIGRLLRRLKIDEFPQLFNVLRGEMSLVGPRPEVRQYVELYSNEERAILDAKPGITDWATLWNPDEGAILAGAPDPEKAYLTLIRPTKLRLQLEYVRRRSLLTDLRIILQTALIVLGRPFGMEPARPDFAQAANGR